MTGREELEKYYQILCHDYPTFLDKYIETKMMQRLATIGQFCGSDYTNLYNCRYWYSRLDHCVACALMTWHFTGDKKQTLAALFHDSGTPIFSHCVDYLLEDYINQESAEINIKEVLLNSLEILNLLKEDHVLLEDVIDIERYSIVENKKPKICVDRLEGVLHTGLIWHQFWQLEDIKEIYDDIVVLNNEDNELEIGFGDLKIADKFFEGVFYYGIALQKNEDKFMMQFIADCLRELLDKKIDFASLYTMSEKEAIDLFLSDQEIRDKWLVFVNADKLCRSDEKSNQYYSVSVDCKKRFVVPLVIDNGKVGRLDQVSKRCKNLISEYLNFNDSKYSYLEGIEKIDRRKQKRRKKITF